MQPVLFVGFKAYNIVFTVPRARAVIVNEQGQILLVRHWAGGSRWSLPGGGVEKGETPQRAIQRELKEELNLVVTSQNIEYFTTIHTEYEAPIFIVHVQCQQVSLDGFNRREIAALNWVTLDSLPSRLTVIARRVLAKVAAEGKICYTGKD